MYPIIWHGLGGKPNNIKSPFFLTVVLVLVLVLTIVLVTVLSL